MSTILKAVLENLDELSETLRDAYTEKDGKYILSVEGVEEHPSVTALRNALQGERARRAELVKEVAKLKEKAGKVPDDFDPDELNTLRAKVETLEAELADPNKGKGGPDAKAMQEAVAARRMLEQKIAGLEKTHAGEIEKWQKLVGKRDDYIKKLLVDDGLQKALTEVGVERPFIKAVKSMLAPLCKVEEENGEYNATVETDGGPLDIDRFVNVWATSDEGKNFVAPAKGGDAGGGKPPAPKVPGSDQNPWSKEHWNLTRQGQIFTQDRSRAEKLAKAAGKPVIPGVPA